LLTRTTKSPPEIDEKGAKEFAMSTDFGSMALTLMTKEEEDDYVLVVLTNKNRKETTFWRKDCAKNCTETFVALQVELSIPDSRKGTPTLHKV
jgi:hypothetical protein